MPDLAAALEQLDAAIAATARSPLSRRKAMLAALLLDAAVEQRFAASDEVDILAFRTRLAAGSPALALVLALCAMRTDGPRLVVDAVEVPLADYAGLDVADFMVSLYNGHTVQRVLVALPDGTRHDFQAVLAEARTALGAVI